MAVSDIFDIGRQGLSANRQALQTTSNNIANANTPGYNRQRTVLESRPQTSTDGTMVGGGVDVDRVIRVHDQFVDRQLVDESKTFGTSKTRADGLKHLETVIMNGGGQVSDLVNKFFNSYRELSSNPEQPALRAVVADSARASVDGFRKMSDSLYDLKKDVDLRLEGMCAEVNSDAKEFADLNEKIAGYVANKQQPNELLDKRDVIVRRLAQRCGFEVSEDDSNHINLGGAGLGALILGGTASELHVERTPEHGDKSAGDVDIFMKSSMGTVKVTNAFKEGELAGLIDVRDHYINPATEWLDNAAHRFATAVNEVHSQGVGGDGVGQRALFEISPEAQGTAGTIKLSKAVENSFDAIAAGSSPEGTGDNRIALAIAALQNQPLMPTDAKLTEGSVNHYTLGESLNALVGKVGTEAAREQQLFDHHESIVGQLENYRQSISGVSLEEEAANMMQQQAVFNAAAKTMKMGDELLQTILSLKQ
jgi:flagellar hook-associated protein 1